MSELRDEYAAAIAEEWDDLDHVGDPDEWPYPTHYTRRILAGPLADAIRRRLGVDANALVTATEEEVSGGWSEYTQETDYNLIIECAGIRKEFWSYDAGDNLSDLLAWLDGAN